MKHPNLSAAELRGYVLAKRRAMEDDVRMRRSAQIVAAVQERLDAFPPAVSILCFYPLKDEVNLLSLYDCLLHKGRRLFFPVTKRDTSELFFYAVRHMDAFTEGAFHVKEPVRRDDPFLGREEYVAITPGVVFSADGGRIGFGKGYYDRFFTRFPNGYRIGVAFSEQMFATIPQTAFDVPMDEVVFA